MKRTAHLLAIVGFAAAMCLVPSGEGKPRPQAPAINLRPQGDTLRVEVNLPNIEGVLSLTLPELINDATRRLVYTGTNLKRVEWRKGPRGEIVSEWRELGLAWYRLEAVPELDGIVLKWKMTNLSKQSWMDAAGNICMRSRQLPAFFDPAGERIFLRNGGRWIAVRETWEKPGSYWYLPPGKEVLGIMKPHLADGSYKIGALRPDEAIIAVRSRDGRYVLAQAWPESRYLLANVHPNYVCTEAPPSFGRIAADETVEVTGKIYFFPGNLEDLEARYKNDLHRKIRLVRAK